MGYLGRAILGAPYITLCGSLLQTHWGSVMDETASWVADPGVQGRGEWPIRKSF